MSVLMECKTALMNAIAIPVTGPYANPPIKAGKVEKSTLETAAHKRDRKFLKSA